MSELDALPPDQRAALQLLLKQGQTYDQLASLLGMGVDAVRGRAHAALDALGPATGLGAEERAEVADYLLGQQTGPQRESAYDLLATSADARAWASPLATVLRPHARDDLPEIPTAEPPAPPPPAREEPVYEEPAYEELRARPPSSRLGGALVLGGLGIVIAVVLILIINGGDDGPDRSTLSTNPATQTGTTQQRPVAQINLVSATGNSRQVGLAQVFENDDRRALIVAGQGLRPGAYALWIYNTRSDARLLGFVPERIGRDGRFATQGELPANADRFRRLIVTLERVTRRTRRPPSRPGEIVLQGNLDVGG